MSEPPILTAEQLAERWQVSTDHVYALAREGRIPAIRLGQVESRQGCEQG